jgi:hypothetical protein
VLTALLIACFAAALFLAGPRRREMLRSVGFAFVAAGLLALALRGFAGDQITSSLTQVSSAEPAVEAVWSIATSLLVTVATSALAFGIILVIAAWAAGGTRPAVALRRHARPYAEQGPGRIYGGALVVFLILIAWAPIAAFHKPLGILVFAILFALGLELLLRQTLREFPDAEKGEVGARLRSSVSRLRPSGGAPAAATAGPAAEELDGLERLSALHRSGDLSDAEFAAAKARLLG